MQDNRKRIEELVSKINDSDEAERRRAVEELGDFQREQTLPTLIHRLQKETNRGVQEAIADAIIHIGGIYSITALLPLLDAESPQLRNLVSEVLVEVGREQLDFLFDMLRDERKDVRKFIVDILGDIRDPSAVPFLIRAISDPDINVICSTAESLGKIGDARGVEPLIAAFKVNPPEAGFYCISGLGHIKDERAVDFLLGLLGTAGDPITRHTVICALGNQGDPRAFDALAPFLEDTSVLIQRAALKALGVIDIAKLEAYFKNTPDKNKLFECILAAMDSDDEKLHEFTLSALEVVGYSLGAKVIVRLVEKDKALPECLIKNLFEKWHVNAAMLTPMLENNNERVRRLATTALGEMTEEDTSGTLLDILYDRSPVVRAAAARALARFTPEKVEKGLIGRLADEEKSVRCAAAATLGAIGSAAAVPELERLLQSDEDDAVEVVISALGMIGGQETEQLIVRGMAHENNAIRERCIKILGLIQFNDRIGAILAQALGDANWEVRREAVTIIGNQGSAVGLNALAPLLADTAAPVRAGVVKIVAREESDATLELLKPLLQDPDAWVRYEVIQSIGRWSSEKVVPLLIDQLSSTESLVRVGACEMLAFSGDPRAIEAIKGIAKDKDPDVRRAVARSLGMMQ